MVKAVRGLLFAAYAAAGVYTGGSYHDYARECVRDNVYERTVVAVVFWPITQVVMIVQQSSCPARTWDV